MQEAVGLSNLQTRITAWLGTVDADDLLAALGAGARARIRDPAGPDPGAAPDVPAGGGPRRRALACRGSRPGRSCTATSRRSSRSRSSSTAKQRRLPMSEVRNLASDPDRDVRRRAYEAEVAVWEEWAVPLAAALNSVKGATQRPGRAPDVGVARSTRRSSRTRIDRATLDAMLAGSARVAPRLPALLRAPRRRPSGSSGSPGTTSSRRSPARAGCGATTRGASSSSSSSAPTPSRMRDYAERAFRENWIDAEPRDGQARRRLLHAGPRGRVADHGQLLAGLPRRLDARARARPRLPQHQPGRAHAASSGRRR